MGGDSFSTTEIFKEGSWEPGPSLPQPLWNHCQVEVGGQVVIAGGRESGGAVARTLVMDGDSWTEVSSMVHKRQFHACAEFSGKIYSIGGETAAGYLL